jgi:hypothetical protein
MLNRISGECLCGTVKFSVNEDFDNFYLCHCKQCQQITGSAFAANILTSLDNITWICGTTRITTFRHPDRDFSKAFCDKCGSGLPYPNKTNTALVIPAGCLKGPIKIKPEARVFAEESPNWLEQGLQSKPYNGFVTSK